MNTDMVVNREFKLEYPDGWSCSEVLLYFKIPFRFLKHCQQQREILHPSGVSSKRVFFAANNTWQLTTTTEGGVSLSRKKLHFGEFKN